jgi:hypothetical protein
MAGQGFFSLPPHPDIPAFYPMHMRGRSSQSMTTSWCGAKAQLRHFKFNVIKSAEHSFDCQQTMI